LEAFFSAMPADVESGMAFVIVQHLAPDHPSLLTDLVQRRTRSPVFEVKSGMVVAPNSIYVLPPNRDMALLHGSLQLLEPTTPRLRRHPIDFFLKSLAQDQRERAIGIVFSGTGSDGTLGVRAIKGEGGMVMVQQPESAEYDGMPRSAIATGLVDFVLPVAEMPAKLIAYAKHAFGKTAPPASGEPPADDAALAKIFVLLRAQTGHDFSRYKQSTICRRLQRRMAVHQIDQLETYVRLLQESPAEVVELFRDLLIRVTSFFRDADAFDVLKSELAKRVFTPAANGTSIRVWVPGCCTGEEAYSLAILLDELAEELGRSVRIHVFATDIDSAAIEQARSGVYPAGIASEMAPERLARAFDAEPESGQYRVKRTIRDMLVFSEHDVARDPPFSRLDLISCRNLLIYLGTELQTRVLTVFHYALNPGGLLFLGTSESVGDLRSLFTVLESKSKTYSRNPDSPGVSRTELGRLYPSIAPVTAPLRHLEPRARGRRLPLRELTEREMLQQFGAVGVLVNERGDILYLHGRTGRYLEPTPGESSLNVLGMAREGLRRDLTAALHAVVASKKPSRRPGLRVRTNGNLASVDLTIRVVAPDPAVTAGPSLYLIILEEPRTTEPAGPVTARPIAAIEVADDPAADADNRIASLKGELREQAEYLEISRHDLEISNDDLKTANEELQSLNEELQSTNEEMETSKEELQSVNEELATVNAELQQRVLELSRSNNDLNNLIAGTGVDTIFVDHELRVQRFTPEATALVNLIPADVGRPLGQIVSNLVGYDRLVPDLQRVLDSLTPLETEVRTANAWYLLRIRPYRTLKNVIEGAVITFTEITELKSCQEGLRRLAVVVRDSRDAVVVQDLAGRILAWNPGAARLYGWTESEALAMNIRDLVPETLRDEAVARVQELGGARSIQPYRSQRIDKDGRIIEIELTASALTNEAGVPYAISTTEREYHD
jgi:two-component system, chemotaxis family, CheB/CheR fusion protein